MVTTPAETPSRAVEKTLVLRQLCDRSTTVETHDGMPVRFQWDQGMLSVTAHLKALRLIRSQDSVDIQFWQLEAIGAGHPTRIYDLECDQGEWRVAATWHCSNNSEEGEDDTHKGVRTQQTSYNTGTPSTSGRNA
jgi:hypothetical protein